MFASMNSFAKAKKIIPTKITKNGSARIPLYLATTKRIPGNHITGPTFDASPNP